MKGFHGPRSICIGQFKITKKGNFLRRKGCGRTFIHEGDCPYCKIPLGKDR